MKKFDATIWESVSIQEKMLVKERLKRININSVLAMVFAFVCYVVCYALAWSSHQSSTSYLIKIIIIFSLIFILHFIACSFLCATALVHKEMMGKFEAYIAFLIMGIYFSGFIGWLIALGIKKPLRKRLINRLEKQFGITNASFGADELMTFGYDFRSGTNGKIKSEHLAIACFKKAANLNDSHAHLELGFYEEDNEDIESARAHYAKAYELGNARGAYFMARTFEKGNFILQDEKEAFFWYKKAADANEPLSMFYAGLAYLNGKVVPKNEQQGIKYIERSASLGEYDASFYLGVRYKEKGDFARSEEYLVKALEISDCDEERNDAYNELGNIWVEMWKKSQEQEHYQLALQLFQKAKLGGHSDGNDNYSLLASMLPSSYPSLQTLLNSDLLSIYFETVKDNLSETTDSIDSINQPAVFDNSDQILELSQLSKEIIKTMILKIICFGVGLAIVLWGRSKAAELNILLPFVFLIGVIIAGLPGIFKAFVDSYNYSSKWDRFFGDNKYQASYSPSTQTVSLKKKQDWFSIILITIFNLLYTAIFMPFEILKDLYRFIKVRNQIKKIRK